MQALWKKPWKDDKKQELKILGLALLIPQLAGWIGALATATSVNSWYQRINKPSWNPPSKVFGPVWTVLYLLQGVASWLVWRRGQRSRSIFEGTVQPPVQQALGLYGVQLFFNTLWSVIFFGFRSFRLATIELALLLGLIGATIQRFFKVSRLAGWLMVPYMAWSAFAAILNGTVWWMNRDR